MRAHAITPRAGRLVAAGALVVTSILAAGCDLTVGPPTQDIGYDHNVGPAKAPATVGATAGTSPGSAGRRSARSTPHE